MFSGKIKLSKELSERVDRCAKAGGYSSPEEFVQHILERELARLADDVHLGVGIEHGRDQAAHGRRIVDDEYARWCRHAPLLCLPV